MLSFRDSIEASFLGLAGAAVAITVNFASYHWEVGPRKIRKCVAASDLMSFEVAADRLGSKFEKTTVNAEEKSVILIDRQYNRKAKLTWNGIETSDMASREVFIEVSCRYLHLYDPGAKNRELLEKLKTLLMPQHVELADRGV